MFCAKCKDQDTLGLDTRSRFGGIYELEVDDANEPGFWGERWELYKVSGQILPSLDGASSTCADCQTVHPA